MAFGKKKKKKVEGEKVVTPKSKVETKVIEVKSPAKAKAPEKVKFAPALEKLTNAKKGLKIIAKYVNRLGTIEVTKWSDHSKTVRYLDKK